MKSLFISHGAPNLILTETPAARFLGGKLQLPEAATYVVVSAHWCSRGAARVAAAAQPETIHDFGGFEDELYRLRYPAAGDAVRAASIVAALTAQGIAAVRDDVRGFDHGVWVPLLLARPQADIPVIPVSLPYPVSAAQAMAFGAALRAAVGDELLIIGSGAITHRLAGFGAYGLNDPPAPEAAMFRDWMALQLAAGNREALAAYRTQAPHAAWNHPTDDHLLPLFVALGAGGVPARCLHSSWEWGILAMDVWEFGE